MEFTGWYPYEIWNRSTYTLKKYLLSNCHVFGAPTYVLEPKLQNLDVNNLKNSAKKQQDLVYWINMHKFNHDYTSTEHKNQEHLPIVPHGV